MKSYAFWFHYNKPASDLAKSPRLTVRWRGQAITVKGLTCSVPTFSKIRSTHPRVVIAGKATNVTVSGGVASIS
jgi:hypothetical protein